MAYNVLISKKRGIVVLRYHGFVFMADGWDAIAEYSAHADYHPSQKHLIDLSQLRDFETDYVTAILIQAKVADLVTAKGYETFCVICATSPNAMKLANIIRKSWEGCDQVFIRIAETEENALALLGQCETTIDDFIAIA